MSLRAIHRGELGAKQSNEMVEIALLSRRDAFGRRLFSNDYHSLNGCHRPFRDKAICYLVNKNNYSHGVDRDCLIII